MGTTSDMVRAVSIYRVEGGIFEREWNYEFRDNNISHDIDTLAISPDGSILAAGYRTAVAGGLPGVLIE